MWIEFGREYGGQCIGGYEGGTPLVWKLYMRHTHNFGHVRVTDID